MSVVLFGVTYVILWAVVLLLLGAVFLLYRHHGRMLLASREGRASQGPESGQPLPRTRVRDMDGAVIELGAPTDRPRFVYLTAATCQPCREARTVFAAFAAKYRAVLDSVLVCSGGREAVAEFAAELPREVRVVADPRNEVASRLRVQGTPFALVLDRHGVVQGTGACGASPEAFERFIKRLEAAPILLGEEAMITLAVR